MTARPYKAIPKSDRVKLEVKCWQDGNEYHIYARPEQLEPFFHREGFFTDLFLKRLDAYRSCGFVKRAPLDNVRVVRVRSPDTRDQRDAALEAKVRRLNALRQVEKENRRTLGKIVGFRVKRPGEWGED